MGILNNKTGRELVKKGVEKLAKYIIDEYKKSRTRTTVGILFQTKDGKWEVQYVDMVLTPEMQKEINQNLTDLADHKITQEKANQTIVRKFQVCGKDKPAFNTNLTLAEWSPDKNLAFSAGQIIPISSITKSKMVSTEGYKIDYQEAYICTAPVAKTFEKLNKKGVKNPLRVLNSQLLYEPEEGFETPKQFKDATKQNLKFIKRICKKNNIAVVKEFTRAWEAVEAEEAKEKAKAKQEDLDLDLTYESTVPDLDLDLSDEYLLDLDLDDDLLADNKMGMNAGQIYDDIDLDLEGEPVQDAKPIQPKHNK